MGSLGLIHYVGMSLTLRSCPQQLKHVSYELRVRIRCCSKVKVCRKQVLEQVDKELTKGDDRAALALVKDFQGKPGGLRCFGAARQRPNWNDINFRDQLMFHLIYNQVMLFASHGMDVSIIIYKSNYAMFKRVSLAQMYGCCLVIMKSRVQILETAFPLDLAGVPQRLYTLDELKLNGIEALSLLSPVDTTLGSIERNLQIATIVGGLTAWYTFGISMQQIFYISLGLLFLWTLDVVAFSGGIGNLVIDTIGHSFSPKYHQRVIQHEAGHFLVAYLVGILPKSYTISSLDALKKEGSLNVQAGTAFVDFEFLEEVNAGKVSATTLNRFSCLALAGVSTEYLIYGFAEGGLNDIRQLDLLLKGLSFTQKKADSQVRWSVLNTVLLLRRHEAARAKLAEAISMGNSVGSCIDIIENSINVSDL